MYRPLLIKDIMKIYRLVSYIACAWLCSVQAESKLITTGFVTNLVPPSPPALNRTVEPDGRRLFTIYLPDGYDDPVNSGVEYPSVYFCPGFTANNETLSDGNRDILDELIALGQLPPVIMIAIDPSLINSNAVMPPPLTGPFFYGNSWYVDSELNGLFETYIVEQLVPYIDANYRTLADRNFRAIFGHSMGGFGAAYLGIRHPDLFCSFACESPTPIFLMTTDLADPGNQAFVLNSWMLLETLANGGKINPEAPGTFFIMSIAGALTPNLSQSTPFIAQQSVDMPVLVDANGFAVLTPGVNTVVNFVTGQETIVNQYMVLDPAVINTWQEKDWYFFFPQFIDTIEKQAIYYDGGTREPLNNYGSRLMSDKLITFTVDNEYLLYDGFHDECLNASVCARLTTVMKTFTAFFAQAGYCINTVTTKLMGNLDLIFDDSSSLSIPSGTVLQVQTSDVLPVTATNVNIALNDNAAIHIGTDGTKGGAFQIGDPFNKALLVESNDGPPSSLASHTVACSIMLNGTGTLFEVGNAGFFGIGMGIVGKSAPVPHAPQFANFWGMSSLANVTNTACIINQGTFKHAQIASGNDPHASVIALGEADTYTFDVDPIDALLLGGGNLICLQQSNAFTAPPVYPRTVRYLFPTIFDRADDLPAGPFDIAGGIRNFADFNPNATDLFLNKPTGQPIGSTTFYTNTFKRQIMASFNSRNKDIAAQFAITTASLDDLCNFLSTQPYLQQPSKRANAATNQGTFYIDYIDVAPPPPEFPDVVINRVAQDKLPIDPCQKIDFAKATADGVLGDQVESFNGERVLISVYDLDLP
jgi:S-formylglutathione hydrolase FrmB